MRVAVDSAQVAVAGVPIEFTNLSPTLVAVTPDRRVTALVSTVGGPARVVAAIRGAVDTLRLTVAQGVAVSPGHATLRTIAPGNTIQLSGGIGGVTWLSRSPAVATVSSTGLVTATGRGTATIVASSGGVGDSIVVAVGNPALPGDAVALALGGGRTFGMARVGQPIAVDVLVDPAAVPVELLGSYNARFIWNTAVMRFDSTQVGTFAAPTLNTDSTSIGVVRFAAVDPIGSIGVQTLVRLWFTGMTPGTSGQALQITEMSAAQTFTDFLRTNHVIVASGNVTIKP